MTVAIAGPIKAQLGKYSKRNFTNKKLKHRFKARSITLPPNAQDAFPTPTSKGLKIAQRSGNISKKTPNTQVEAPYCGGK